MKNKIKIIIGLFLAIVSICFVACGKNEKATAEKITLDKTILSEIEFENSDKVKIKQNGNSVLVFGEIEAMSPAQKNAYGIDHVS